MKTRILHTKIWKDPWFRKLKPDEKLYFFYLITNEYINTLHLYELSDDVVSLETGISEKRVTEIKNKFVDDEKIDIYKFYIYISNSYKYQEYKGIKNNYQKLRIIFELSNKTIAYFAKYLDKIINEIKIESEENNTKDDKFLNLLKRVEIRLEEVKKDTPIDRGIDTSIYTGNKSEYRNINNINNINNNIGIVKGIFSDITILDDTHFQDIATAYNVPIAFVRSKYDDMVNWHQQDPRKNNKKNWKATLRTWVKKDAIERRENVTSKIKYVGEVIS